MTDDDADAASDLWDNANDMDGKIGDIAKRAKQASAVLASHTTGIWKEGSSYIEDMKNAAKSAKKATKKILSLTAQPRKKLLAFDIVEFIRKLKKYDKEIINFDKAVRSFIVWRRKESREIQVECDDKEAEVSHINSDVISIIKYTEFYFKYRSVFNKELQSFQNR